VHRYNFIIRIFRRVSYVMSVNQTKEETRYVIVAHKSKLFKIDVKTKKQNFHETLFLLLTFPDIK